MRRACCRRGTISSVGTHGLCVLPRPQGASIAPTGAIVRVDMCVGGGMIADKPAISSVGTHGLCVLPRPQGASIAPSARMCVGDICAGNGAAAAARRVDAQTVRPYTTNSAMSRAGIAVGSMWAAA